MCSYKLKGVAHLQVSAGSVKVLEEGYDGSLWARNAGIWLLQADHDSAQTEDKN